MPYDTQHNGVAERKNNAICEVAKAMLCDLDYPLSLWVEVSRTVVYIQNRCPHAILWENTPGEVLIGRKPTVDHMRIFGTLFYIHVPNEKSPKIEHPERKGHSLVTVKTQKLITSMYLVKGTLRLVEL